MMERTLQPSSLIAGLRGGKARRRGQYDASFFVRRTASIVVAALVFVALGALSGTYVGFDFVQAILDVPGGFAWMAVQFAPPSLPSANWAPSFPPWVRRFSPP